MVAKTFVLPIWKLDLWPLKWHAGAGRGANIKASEKTPFLKYGIINNSQLRSVKCKSNSPKYQHTSVKALLTTKTKNITVALDVRYMAS